MHRNPIAVAAILCSIPLVACTTVIDAVGGNGEAQVGEEEGVDDPRPTWLQRVYETALGRAPDPEGYAAWDEAIASGEITIADAARGFLRSPEFQNNVIVDVYARYLKRGVDPSGQATYGGFLAQGGRPEQFEVWVLSSDEYNGRGGNDVGAFVTNLYRDVLAREPDPNGYAGWTSWLNAGATRAQVAWGFVTSEENRRNVVAGYYRRYLGREPEEAGLAYWTAALGGGTSREAIQAAFLVSDEFLATTSDGEDLGAEVEGEEEEGEGGDCGEEAEACDDGTCIPYEQFCDGAVQCPDGSDELPDDCEGGEESSCGDEEDVCDDGTCIPFEQFCDGAVQCPDGSDELPDYCE